MLSSRGFRREGRRGLSLMELLVALLLVSAVGALIVPAVKARLDRAEVSAVVDNLNNVRGAIVRYRDTVGRYPSRLMQLYKRPGVDGSPTTDLCGGTLPAANIARWSGPYLANPVGTAGIQVGRTPVILNNTLERNVADGEYLRIVVSGLRTQSADDVDMSFDGGDVPTQSAGTVTYSVAQQLLRFWIAISGC